MTQPTPTTAPPALLNITLGVMLALMLGWFFHIASGVLVPMVLGLMISYVVMAVARLTGTIPWIGVRLSPGLRLAVAAVLICYGLVQLVTLLAANLAAFASSAPEYQTRLLAAVQTLANMAGFQGDLTGEIGVRSKFIPPMWRQSVFAHPCTARHRPCSPTSPLFFCIGR